MNSTMGRPLPGRAGQLATFEKIFDTADTTVHVVIEGEPGSGRTTLLRAAAALAAGRGFQVAWATGREAERELAFGVAGRLLAPVLGAGPAELTDGLTADVTGDVTGHVTGEAGFAALQRLHRLAIRLAAGAPLLLVVDDVQWCDAASLGWLGFVARRSATVPIMLVVARTTGTGAADDVALDDVTGSFEQLPLGPLRERDVAAVARETLGGEPATAFAAAAHRVTGGHPGLLVAVLADVSAARLPPSAQTARRIADHTGPAVDRWVRERLHRASPYAERLARAICVLGDRTDDRTAAAAGSAATGKAATGRAGTGRAGTGALAGERRRARAGDHVEADTAAALAGLGTAAATHAADALVESGQVHAGDRTLSLRHPIVRTAVLRGMSETERLLAHARAARLLHARGAPDALVIGHLLATGPVGDPWAVPLLRAAADAALDDGACELAVTRLRRALAESPSGRERLEVLVDLGRAELRTNVADAVTHLTEAFELAAEPRTAAGIAEHLAAATWESEDAKAAIGVLDRAIAGLAVATHPANVDLVADLDILALGIGAGVTTLAYAHRIERLSSRAAERPGAARAIAGITAYRLSAAGRSRRESVARAREVLALGPPEAMRDFYAYRNAALSLTRAGELDPALRCANVLVARGAALNQPTFAGTGHALRAWVALLAGRLAEAVDETHTALDAHSVVSRDASPKGAEMYLIDAYLDLGDTAEVERLLTRVGLLGGEHTMPYWATYSLESRGRYRLLRDDPAGALADFLEAGRQLVDCGVVNPAAGAWRSNAALVLHDLGDDAAATRLAAEELMLARAWGASGPVGVALRATGLIRADAPALEESVAVLAGSPARLEYARSLAELGRFRLDRRQRDEARRLLREAYVIAMDCGAAPLVARIDEALMMSGARRPRPRPRGVAALTAQERRIAELAAAGATNKEIAQALFLIQRTVETHLTSVYRKLGIDGRRMLAAALGG